MLKAIVFDFDGVVVDSEPIHYRAFMEVGKEMGLRSITSTTFDTISATTTATPFG